MEEKDVPVIDRLINDVEGNKPRQDQNDAVQWDLSKDNKHSVKSFLNKAYSGNYQRSLSDKVASFIWKKKAPPRAELTMWFLALNNSEQAVTQQDLICYNKNKHCAPFARSKKKMRLTCFLHVNFHREYGQVVYNGGRFQQWYMKIQLSIMNLHWHMVLSEGQQELQSLL